MQEESQQQAFPWRLREGHTEWYRCTLVVLDQYRPLINQGKTYFIMLGPVALKLIQDVSPSDIQSGSTNMFV